MTRRQLFNKLVMLCSKKDAYLTLPNILKQAATLFLDKWGVKCAQHGHKIVCFFHEPMKTKKKNADCPQGKREYKVKESQKVHYKCPFKIKFTSLIGRVAANKLPDVFHEVKITQTNFNHSCELSPVFLGESRHMGGHLELDIPSLKTAPDLLCLYPNTKTRVLHPYLVKALPNWHPLNTHRVSNFRKRAVKHWSIHGSFEDEDSSLTITEVESPVSPPPMAADNNIDLANESVRRTNYKKLLRRVMQESSETWKVKIYDLRDCKTKTPRL
jgi:hypothetical protein